MAWTEEAVRAKEAFVLKETNLEFCIRCGVPVSEVQPEIHRWNCESWWRAIDHYINRQIYSSEDSWTHFHDFCPRCGLLYTHGERQTYVGGAYEEHVPYSDACLAYRQSRQLRLLGYRPVHRLFGRVFRADSQERYEQLVKQLCVDTLSRAIVWDDLPTHSWLRPTMPLYAGVTLPDVFMHPALDSRDSSELRYYYKYLVPELSGEVLLFLLNSMRYTYTDIRNVNASVHWKGQTRTWKEVFWCWYNRDKRQEMVRLNYELGNRLRRAEALFLLDNWPELTPENRAKLDDLRLLKALTD